MHVKNFLINVLFLGIPFSVFTIVIKLFFMWSFSSKFILILHSHHYVMA